MAKRRAGSKGRKKSRTKRASRSTAPRTTWRPSRFALWSQSWGDPNNDSQTYPTTVLLRHPTAPFTATVTTTGTVRSLEDKLKKTAHAYLTEVDRRKLINPSFNLPYGWLDALDPVHPGGDPTFGWLPFTSPPRASKTLLSFWARRTNARAVDSMAILLASQRSGPGFGIRVVAHVRKRSRTRFQISISGMSASLPFGIFRPLPLRRPLTPAARVRVQRLTKRALNFLTNADFKNVIASTHGLDSSSLAQQGVRLTPINPGRLKGIHLYAELNATGQKGTNGGAPVSVRHEPYYSFVFATELTMIGTSFSSGSPPALLSKTVLVADAGPARSLSDRSSIAGGRDKYSPPTADTIRPNKTRRCARLLPHDSRRAVGSGSPGLQSRRL